MESREVMLPRLLGMIFKELGISPDDEQLDSRGIEVGGEAVAVGGTMGDLIEAIPMLLNLTGNLIKVSFHVQSAVTVIAREGQGDRIGDTQKAFEEAMDQGMEAATRTLMEELRGMIDTKEFKAVVGDIADELKARRAAREQKDSTAH